MKPIKRPPKTWLKDYISHSFQNSGKKNLLITGTRSAGKSTVFNLIRQEKGFPAVLSHAIRGADGFPERIVLTDSGGNQTVVIARREGERLKALESELDGAASVLLKQLIQETSEWVGIDEIGFIERKSLAYTQCLHRLFDQKNVVAVLRKDERPFFDQFKTREDCFLIDIDAWETWPQE